MHHRIVTASALASLEVFFAGCATVAQHVKSESYVESGLDGDSYGSKWTWTRGGGNSQPVDDKALDQAKAAK